LGRSTQYNNNNIGGGEWLVVTEKIHKEEGEMGEERE